MNLSNTVFENFFRNKVNNVEFIEELGIYEENFAELLFKEFCDLINNQEIKRLEYLIYALMLWNDSIKDTNNKLKKFLSFLNVLLVSNWHTQHENITLILEKISCIESLDYLYQAIELHPEYLLWDDNYSFEVKCVRAIYYIGKEKAFPYLEKLSTHPNKAVREMALRQIKKLM